MIAFTVYGRPQPAGSKTVWPNKKTGRPIVTDSNPKAKPWKQEVVGVAEGLVSDLLGGPLNLRVDFYMARPKSHYGTGRNATKLKPSAPVYPTTKPDATKLLRGLEDALSSVIYRDDAQIVVQHIHKHYGVPERTVVSIYELGPAYQKSCENPSRSRTASGSAGCSGA